MALVQDVLVLLSFGITAPLLGFCVAMQIFARTLRLHHIVSVFLIKEEAWQGDGITLLEADCQDFCERTHPLYAARNFLLAFSSLFLSVFLVDTAGNSEAQGTIESIWAPLLMFFLPFLIPVFMELRSKIQGATSISQSMHKSSKNVELGILQVDNIPPEISSISLSPLHS